MIFLLCLLSATISGEQSFKCDDYEALSGDWDFVYNNTLCTLNPYRHEDGICGGAVLCKKNDDKWEAVISEANFELEEHHVLKLRHRLPDNV